MTKPKINGTRLSANVMAMAKTGAPLDVSTRDLFMQWCKDAGCAIQVDQLGNIAARRAGRNNALAPVGTGGHSGMKPVDGVVAALVGLEVIHTLNERGIETERPIEVFLWIQSEVSHETHRPMHAFLEVRLEGDTSSSDEAAITRLTACGDALLPTMIDQANELPDVFTSNATTAIA